MLNKKIKELLRQSGIRQWEVARALRMNEFSFSRKLRDDLTQDEYQQLLSIIKKLIVERRR